MTANTVSSLLRSIRGPCHDPSELLSVCSHSMNTVSFARMSNQFSKTSQKRAICTITHCSALSSLRTVTSQKSPPPLPIASSLLSNHMQKGKGTHRFHTAQVYTADLEIVCSKVHRDRLHLREGQQAPVTMFTAAVLSLWQLRVTLDRKT